MEKIQGKIVFVGAENACFWDTCRYIRRMKEQPTEKNPSADAEYLLYPHGTYFVFPDSMLTRTLPFLSGLLVCFFFQAVREYPREWKETRVDLDRNLKRILKEEKE